MKITSRGVLGPQDAIILLVCLVFVAVGFTPLLSVATVGLVYVAWRVGVALEDVAETTLFLGVALCFPLGTALWDPTYSFDAAALRIAICLSLMFFLIGKRVEVESPSLRKYLMGALITLTAAIALQRVAMIFGVYVNMPAFLLGQKGSGTLVDASMVDFLRATGYLYYRPSLLYAEPSYLGLVVLSLLASILAHSHKVRDAMLAGAAVVVTVLASGSAYLAVSAVAVFIAFGASSQRATLSSRRRFGAVLGLVLAAFLAVSYLPVDQRLVLLFTAGDVSAATRLTKPLGYVQSTWTHISPFGYPLEAVYSKFGAMGISTYPGDAPLDNGAWNILINFGVFGILVFAALRLRVGGWFGFTYLVLALMQNGAFGSWDKAFIIGFTCVLINSARSAERIERADFGLARRRTLILMADRDP